MCHSGLSPDAPNGAPFSCLVGGAGGGRERWGVGGGETDGLTEIVPEREREGGRVNEKQPGQEKR